MNRKNLTYILSFILILSSKKTFSYPEDPIKEFYITIDGHGLMCPFLSPLFIQKLEEWHPINYYRIENEYALILQLDHNDSHSEKDIKTILINIGYEASKIHITESQK